jgi:hypothetical protein
MCLVYQEPTPGPVPPIPTDGSRVLVASLWQRSEASKKALRELLKEGTTSLEAGGMRDELESKRLAFIPADHSDTCSTVIQHFKTFFEHTKKSQTVSIDDNCLFYFGIKAQITLIP